MEHINVLDFYDKSEGNLRFSFGNLGIVFNGASAQLFSAQGEMVIMADITYQPMAAEINRCRLAGSPPREKNKIEQG